MKKIVFAFVCTFLHYCEICADEETYEVTNPEELFTRELKLSEETYLICVFDATSKPTSTTISWSRIEISSTIVNCVKGSKKIGDILNFFRKIDEENHDPSPLLGKLFYVFIGKDSEGKLIVDPQDPSALLNFSEDYQRLAEKYMRSK